MVTKHNKDVTYKKLISCTEVTEFKNLVFKLDVRGSVHHSTTDEEKSNKMQQSIKILLFPIYMKLNMFRATHRPSSGA